MTGLDTGEPPSSSSLSDILKQGLEREGLGHEREDRARLALLQRPRFTIRARLGLLFLALFLVSAIMASAGWLILAGVEYRLRYVTATDVFANEIQQARRYEKNFFLYRSELSEVLQHLDAADLLLRQAAEDIGPVVGFAEMTTIRAHLSRYRHSIDELIARNRQEDFSGSTDFKTLETSLRDDGSRMVSLALDISKKERAQISSLISVIQKVFILTSVFLLFLLLYVALHLSRHIISRLDRLMAATQRIATGDFSPILPQRKYRDEFSYLTIALNHMMQELEQRQDVLVESHKIRAVGNLTAGIAHELNNPLNNIMLTSEMLKEDYAKLDDEARLDMVNDLIEQAERARSIVKNLLDFVRESEVKREQLHLHNLLEETLRLAGNQIKLNKVKLELEVHPNLPPVYGDRSLLRQLFLNLLLNALDAMPTGGKLTFKASEEKEVGFLAIKVVDTGTGIPAHLLRAIFDPFFTTKPTGKGTGLGLSVSQGIARHHGGNIEVDSTPGQGTTFTVHLPFVTIPAELKVSRNSNGSSVGSI